MCLAESPEFKTFLVKEICFKHKADVILEIKKQGMLELLPEMLLQNEDTVEDIYNIAGSLYPKMKELLRKFFVNNNNDELEDFLKNNDQAGVLVLILGLCSKGATSTGEDLREQSARTLSQSLQKFSTIPLQPIFQARKLTGFSQRDVDLMKIPYLARTFSSLNQPAAGLAQFFSALIQSPESLQNKFLPSMPHDVKFQVLQSAMRDGPAKRTGGNMKYYQCPNGHVYGITDCTQPNDAGRCADCGANIGGIGRNYQLQAGNTVMGNNGDNAQPGYIIRRMENLTEGVREMTLFETVPCRHPRAKPAAKVVIVAADRLY